MKPLFYLNILCFLATFIGNKNINGRNKSIQDSNSIDYKKATYKLYIGQTVDSIDKIIDLRHNYLADDGVINKDSVTHYMNTGEDLVKINGSDCLPALFFTTDKQLLTKFECSIMFSLSDAKTHSIEKCLSDIQPLFTILNSKENRSILAKTLKLSIETAKFIEVFHLEISDKHSAIFYYNKKIK